MILGKTRKSNIYQTIGSSGLFNNFSHMHIDNWLLTCMKSQVNLETIKYMKFNKILFITPF